MAKEGGLWSGGGNTFSRRSQGLLMADSRMHSRRSGRWQAKGIRDRFRDQDWACHTPRRHHRPVGRSLAECPPFRVQAWARDRLAPPLPQERSAVAGTRRAATQDTASAGEGAAYHSAPSNSKGHRTLTQGNVTTRETTKWLHSPTQPVLGAVHPFRNAPLSVSIEAAGSYPERPPYGKGGKHGTQKVAVSRDRALEC